MTQQPEKRWLCLHLSADQAELLSLYMQKMLDGRTVLNRKWVEYVRDESRSWAKQMKKKES